MTRPILLLLALILGSATARAESVAQLTFDLAGATLTVTLEGATHHVPIAPHLTAELHRFRSDLARDTWDRDRAGGLGEALLGPATELLTAAAHWAAWPLEVAPLSALILPGEPEPILHRHEVWYDDPGAPAPVAETGAGSVLLIAPFIPGVDSPDDDPYDLLSHVRGEVRSVALVPRNDTTPDRARTVLAEERPGLVWLRATPEVAPAYLAAWAPRPIWWSRADDESAPGVDAVLEAVAAWRARGGTACVDIWPVTETDRAPAVRRFVRNLTEGQSWRSALVAARRGLAATAGPPQWAGWILVGNPQATVDLQGPSWWQRLFPR